MVAQLRGVGLEDAVLQVAGPEVEHDVHQVEEVGEVIQTEPHQDGIRCGPTAQGEMERKVTRLRRRVKGIRWF